MFRRIAALVGAQALMRLHPAELMVLLEQAWNVRRGDPARGLGHPDHRSDTPGLAIPLPPLVATPPASAGAVSTTASAAAGILASMATQPVLPRGAPRGAVWDHLIYAYMIENTRIYEIFRRVVHEFLHGDKLGAPGSSDTQLWLRSTEELFYRDTPPFSITTLNSHIRPDLRASRRNAYQRMFGMDLNHGTDDNTPYPYIRAEAANTEFVSSFEELLREVWVGHINRTTTSGANPTDNTKIEELAHKLHDMLITRRQSGNLSREEFFFVAMMSWFHLTVDSNLFLMTDLSAEGTSAEQRLFKVAHMVGLPAHGLSRSYFDIADAISAVLIAIETGSLHTSGAAPAFYDPAATPPGFTGILANTMTTIITHWSLITGRDMKAGKVAST